ncbi:MAG TPA: penicillin-binding transpeptidase domain-containing protein [Opitutaceae bacterium]|nr:penicillin-binding transpeptidase domain-containing protein [Opitutaceae bacterium]
MAAPSERSGSMVESRTGYDPRIIAFHGIVALLLAVLACGLAYQQIIKGSIHHEQERQQNERRIITPGARGNILDRQGRLLVANRARFAVVLDLEALRPDFRSEAIRIRNNYRAAGDQDLPSNSQVERIAHVSVAQRYLDQVNALLGRAGSVDGGALQRHLERQLLLPYTLVDDLSPEEFARLTERLPVNSPLQVYPSYARTYPFGAAAAHVLGYVGVNENEDAEEFPGGGLATLKIKGTVGRDGLERQFDSVLQGEAGYTILRVDPAGYKVNPPIDHRLPVQGKSLATSLDIDLQVAAEEALGDQKGAVVAMDVRTGEVLVMASEPGYDLNAFSPHLSLAAAADIENRKAWNNNALNAVYSPGSTFKIVVSTAALLSGAITPTDTPADCDGSMMIGNRRFTCDNGLGHHGELQLPEAIAESCDIYFYTVGLKTSAEVIAAQARRFHLDRPTGIELPGETHRMLIPDPAWKLKVRGEGWNPGDTANMAIGQGDVQVTPLDMACFAASFARDETWTRPTLLHDPDRRPQHTAPTGLSAAQRAAILKGMEGCTQEGGTAAFLTTIEAMRVPGVRIAGKTGTAQINSPQGKVDEAWFICFAPLENPEIAVAVAIEGTTPGENFGGGREAAPVASAVLRKYFAKTRAGVLAN